jgi:hypothetical protein
MRTWSQQRSLVIALTGAAVGLLVLGALTFPRLRRIAAGWTERQRVDINLDHGLADCPWPDGTDRLDPEGEVRIEDAFVVVRTDQRTYFSGRVASLVCYSAYLLGPAIALDVRSWDPPANNSYPAPPRDPEVLVGHTDMTALLATYRRARAIVDDFGLSAEAITQAREPLDRWYGGNPTFRLNESLGVAGALASAELFVSERARDYADIRLLFGFPTDVDMSGVMIDSWKHDFHLQQRVKICRPRGGDGGASGGQPLAHAESESVWFAPCPDGR